MPIHAWILNALYQLRYGHSLYNQSHVDFINFILLESGIKREIHQMSNKTYCKFGKDYVSLNFAFFSV